MKRSKCPYCKERVAMKLDIQKPIYEVGSILKICSKCGWIVKVIKL